MGHVLTLASEVMQVRFAIINIILRQRSSTDIHIILYGYSSAYGGFGFTSRLWGLTVDTILSIDVVLANGTISTVSQKNNPDLFFVCPSSSIFISLFYKFLLRAFGCPCDLASSFSHAQRPIFPFPFIIPN
jgi:hypothetical protein